MASGESFKTCGMCGKVWPAWQDFVVDPRLRLLGLQAIPRSPDANALVFEHECGTTVSILATKLRHLLSDLHVGEGLPPLYGTALCNKHCSRLEDLSACDNECRNSGDRRLTLLVRDILRSGALPARFKR